MTCNDCIHQYCCKYDRFFGVDEVENKCNYFKNKADFVEVVRCKDCKHWAKMRYDTLLERSFGDCHNDDTPFHCETRPCTNGDYYCGSGERK